MLAGIKSLLQNPKWRTWLFITFTLLFYYTRTRPPDPIYDIEIVGNQGFLAVGKTGVVVVDIKDRGNLTEITSLDTYGTAYSLQVLGNSVFVADGPDGLKLISTSRDGLELQGSFRTPGEALDVAIKDSNAFVIDSKEDLLVLNINARESSFILTSNHDVPDKAEKIKIVGNRAYISNNKNRFMIFDISAPNNPSQLASIDLQAPIENFIVVGNYAYLAAENLGLVILDISSGVEIVVAGQYNQIRDAKDVDVRGMYAYVASGDAGYYVLDISNFQKITEIGRESSPSDAQLVRSVDDYVYVADDLIGLKSYHSPVLFKYIEQELASAQGLFDDVVVTGNFAYIAAGDAGTKVIDIENRTSPQSVPYIDEINDYATALDIQGDYIYVTYREKGLHQYNIGENPRFPTSEGVEASISGEPQDVSVDGRWVYVASGSDGLQIVDLSDIASPDVYSIDTPGTAKGVFVFGDKAYIADGEKGLQIIAINDPRNPFILQNINAFGDARSVYVSKIKNPDGEERDYAFIANGNAGLYIADITDLNNPVNVATYATEGSANDIIVREQTAYLLTENDGVVLLDISLIDDPKKLGNQHTPGKARRMDLGEDQVVYVADHDRGLRIVSVSDHSQPIEIGFIDSPVTAQVILVRGNQGFMVDGKGGMWVLDVSEPQVPVLLSLYTTPGEAQNLALEGNYAYIADGSRGLQIVNISNLYSPQLDGEFADIDNAIAVAVRGGYAYVVTGERRRLYILDIVDFSNIREVGTFETAGEALNIAIYGGFAYITEGTMGIEVVNIQDPTDPSLTSIGNEFNLQDARSILFRENRAFIADGSAGMKAFNMESPAKPERIYTFPIEGGVATNLTADSEYVFLTVDRKGIFPFDVVDSNNIMYSGIEALGDESREISGDEEFQATSIAALPSPTQGSRQFINYTTSREKGMQIFQANGNAYFSQGGLYETPGEASLLQVILSIPRIIIGVITGQPEIVEAKVWARLWYMFYGTCIFAGLFALYLVLFSQFVLPVQTLRESFKAVTRLYSSLMGEHGPVVFVKEGHVIARQDELERRGPGVARVDLNSAIVFEKRTLVQPQYRQRYNQYLRRESRRGQKVPRARVEGPGVHFIEPYESLHGVADLRPQFGIRPGIQAYTRDGIEFENPVWILYTLGQPPSVLDVTYEGERISENLRVIHFSEADIPKRETIQTLSDEDAQYYERYQTTRRFFQKVKELVSQLSIEDGEPDSKNQNPTDDFVLETEAIAARWEILDIAEIRQFFAQLKRLSADIDEITEQVLREFVNQIHLLADQMLGEVMADFYDNVFQGRKQRGVVVRQLTDELDPDDREEIHRYVQTQTEIRYFANQKELASQIDLSITGSDEVRKYVSKACQLAIRWGIGDRDSVQQFIGCVSALVLEIDTTEASDVEWFFYYASMLSTEIKVDRMIQFYDTINLKMISRYQNGLRDLVETYDLSNFARESMAEMSEDFPQDDDLRLFNLNALELHKSILPEFETHIKKLGDDPANKVEAEIMVMALARFDRITSNLVRSVYPFSDSYSVVADLQHCYSTLQRISDQIKLREGWKFPDFLGLVKIRRLVRNIQKTIQILEQSSEPEFKRYIDLIQIFDYVQNIRGCVTRYRQLDGGNGGNQSRLRSCVVNIKLRTQMLDEIQHPAFQRPVRRIEKWADALNFDDPVYIYFFAKQVDELWEKIAEADRIVVRRFLRKSKKNHDMIRQDIRQFGKQSSSMDADGEIRHYQNSLEKIHGVLQECKIPSKVMNPDTGGGEQIQFGPFQFVRRRVLAAVYSKALDIDQAGEYMPWTDLPVHAAVQTYREMVSKEQYDYLYEPKDPKKYNMPKLKGNFSRAMRNQGVLAFRFVDHVDGAPLISGSELTKGELIFYNKRELKNPKVLRARGIKVIASGFPDLFPVSPKVPEQWLENWRAPWTSKATDVRGQYQLQAARVINQARAQAQRDMAQTLARILRSSRSDEALAMRVFQALESTTIDEDTRQFLPRDTMYLLQSFKQWFLPDQGSNQMKMLGDLDIPDDKSLLDE